jgi:ankyrin repeat protein
LADLGLIWLEECTLGAFTTTNNGFNTKWASPQRLEGNMRTKSDDVYSFACICYYVSRTFYNMLVIYLIQSSCFLGLFRFTECLICKSHFLSSRVIVHMVHPSNWVWQLISKCWQHDSQSRPIMVDICHTFGVTVGGDLMQLESYIDMRFIKIQSELADLMIASNDGPMRLVSATKNGHEDIARLLLDCGVEPNTADNRGKVPLHIAIKNGHEGITRLLLNRGADFNVADNNGSTSLNKAAKHNFEGVARLLLDRGVDLHAADSYGRTPLHRAAEKGHEGMARLLLDSGADLNRTDIFGWTPLHKAAENSHENVARLLLDRGAGLNVADNYGWTPLHWSAYCRRESVARLLLERGASAKATDQEGRIPLNLAMEVNDLSVERLLRTY